MDEIHGNCCDLADAAWLNQDAPKWTLYSDRIASSWASSVKANLIYAIQQCPPTRSFLADWMRHCHFPLANYTWSLCVFIHGSEDDGEMAEYMCRLWQDAPHASSSRDLVMGVVQCFSDSQLLRHPASPGVQKLLQLDRTFLGDTAVDKCDQAKIKTILIAAHHHCSIRAAKGHAALLLDWIFQICPLRCDQQSHAWINYVIDTGHTRAIEYLVEHTRGKDVQLWSSVLRPRHSVLASRIYCPELKPFRIFGVYLYSVGIGFRIFSSSLRPGEACMTPEDLSSADDESVLVEYGPGLNCQAMMVCPSLIREAVNANRSLKKSARS